MCDNPTKTQYWLRVEAKPVSWWDMEEFSARAFYQMGKLIEKVRIDHANRRNLGDVSFSGSAAQKNLSPTELAGLREFALQVREHCAALGLKIPLRRIDELCVVQLITNAQAAHELQDLDREIRWEMENHRFFYLDPGLAEIFDNANSFGAEVAAKFPALQYDITEAGNCLACGRTTACVFHLMRVMESSVQMLGSKLGIALVNEKVWQVILDQVDKAIKALPKGPNAVQMAQLSAHLFAVKLAWRNEVMHPKETYTEKEADVLIQQVHIFMEELARVI